MIMNMDCRTDIMESSKGEGKRLLRTLELKAFRSVVDALRAQGSFTSRKCSVLKNLAATLKVGDERCRSEMRRAVNDNLLKSIAQCSDEQHSDENWRLESARKVARVPMVNEPTVFTALADKVSDWVLSHNRNTVEHESTLIDILESKKCRTEANASRYHSAKLFRPLLTTSSRDAEQIAYELEKIKTFSKLSSNKIHSVKEENLFFTKPNEIPLQVEYPKISVTLAENSRLEEPVDFESNRNNVPIDPSPPKEAIEVQKSVPIKSRAAKGRSRSRQKRSQSAKTSSLQEELSRTVNAVNALVTPVTESNSAVKRPNDDSLNTVTAEWQPREKKSKKEASKKVLSDNEVGKSKASVVRIDAIKSSVVLESGDKNLSFDNLYPTDDSLLDASQETVPSLPKSNVKLTKKNLSVPLEKDFTPHTFNLIPASRRLKMVKKKDNLNGSPLVKEQELVVPADNCEMQSAPSPIIIELKFPKKNKLVDQNKVSDVPQVNDAVLSSSAVTRNGKVSSKEPPFELRKEADEKLKNIPPVLSQTKKTLSLLGNIKVLNLNAKTEEESPKDFLLSNKNKDSAEMVVEFEDEIAESELDLSEMDSGSSVNSDEYSTFDDSDSHSVIEYWDHEDDEDIIANGNNLDCDNEGFEEDDSFKVKVTDDDMLLSHQVVLSDEVSNHSESSGENIVEEIFDDEEFFSDVEDGYESDDTEKLIFDPKDSVNSSSGDGDENCDKAKPSISVSNSEKSDSKMDPSSSIKIAPSASGAAISILKLRKPFAVGTTAELTKPKEVVIVSPKLQKTIAMNVKNEKSPSASPKYQVIPPSQCIVRGQTISLANARLIKTAPKTNQSTVLASGVTTDVPKITLYSSAKTRTGAGLQLSSIASKRVTLPQSTKSSSSATSTAKQVPVKSSTVSVPKKVCRLYDLMDVSEPAFSNSSSKPASKKNVAIKKPAVDVSST